MKAVIIRPGSKNSVQLTDIQTPILGNNEILLRTLKLGIDGTDRDINAGFYGAPPDGDDFLVVGHEALGVVDDIGDDVTGFNSGDLVVPTVRRSCPENCLNCKNDESDMCLSGHYFEHGIYKLHGFASEKTKSNANYLVKIPKDMMDVAVLLEPMSIVEKALTQILEIQRRMRWEPRNALMLGAGPIGQLGTLLMRLKNLNVSTVARRPKDDFKARLVTQAGAQYVNATETNLDSLGTDFDIILEGTGNPNVAIDAVTRLATNGVFCFLGVYGPSQVNFPGGDVFREMVLRNKVLFGSVNANKRYFEMGLDDFRAIKQKFSNTLISLITSKLSLEEYGRAFQPDPNEIKTVIDFSSV